MTSRERVGPIANGVLGWHSTGAATAGSTSHRQGEPAREAHPERAHAGAAELGVQVARERAQPSRDGRRLAGPQLGELPADADLAQGAGGRAGGHLSAVGAEQARHDHGVARVDDLLAEGRHLGGDAGDLVDDDDARTAAPPVRRVGDAVVRVRALGPAVREAHARIMPRTGDQNV